MKQLILYAFILIQISGFSQISILDSSLRWSTIIETSNPNFSFSYFTKIQGDTIIDNNPYMKVLKSTTGDNHDYTWEGLLMREDSGKVYLLSGSTSTVLYDFSLDIGDIWVHSSSIEFEVARIDTILFADMERQRIQLTEKGVPFDSTYCATWIEGIGSLNGVLFPAGFMLIGYYPVLGCFFDSNNLLYSNPNYSSCLPYVDIDDYRINSLQLFPNPTESLVNIEGLGQKSLIRIYSITGSLVKELNTTENSCKINLSNEMSGIYFAQIFIDGDISYKKIILSKRN